jgi:hypothetical protein
MASYLHFGWEARSAYDAEKLYNSERRCCGLLIKNLLATNIHRRGMTTANPAPGAPRNNDGRYAMDIRVFISLLTLTVTISFLAGIYGVTESYRHRGGDEVFRPSYVEEMALRFLFPSLFPISVGEAISKNVDEPNHSNTTPNGFFIAEDEHRPSGQHLLVDIKGVDGDFLNSEELLSKALVDAVKETGYVAVLEGFLGLYLASLTLTLPFLQNDFAILSLSRIVTQWCFVRGCVVGKSYLVSHLAHRGCDYLGFVFLWE